MKNYLRPPWRLGGKALAAFAWLATQGACLTQIPSPQLDLSSLGSVALAGDFDAISVYSYEGQTEGIRKNGAESILSQLPNGAFQSLASTDASINAMCPFVLSTGQLAGVVVGGNFTSIGGVDATAVALFNPTSNEITPLPGIHGYVTSLLCVKESNTVYVGGVFEAANSTNAIAWVGTTGWANLPFAGFNAPVTSIAQAPNGHIVFGGSFTGLGNTSMVTTGTDGQTISQYINLVSAGISSQGNANAPEGLGNPQNIVCPSNSSTASNTPWLLTDNTPGSWRADLQYGFIPSKLRLWNTNHEGRGTKTFRFVAHPLEGIMNLSYVDPSSGKEVYCDATCTLLQNSTLPYQDFSFENQVGMDSFSIEISDWYGQGAGLNGIQVLQDEIFAYASNAFNEPVCSGAQFPSNVSTTGDWNPQPAAQSESQYLATTVAPANVNTTSITFYPNIPNTGKASNYTIIVYTPGCIPDNSCDNRGVVTVSGTLSADGTQKFSYTLYQTNNFDKYDNVHLGTIDACSDSFRPSITITAAPNQGTIEIVASRIQFKETSETGGLNGLFEYNPNQAVVNMNFSESAINSAGTMLKPDAQVEALVTNGQMLYAAGKFTDDSLNNIMEFSNNKASSLPGGGLNAPVSALFAYEDYLYIGGNFSNTNAASVQGLNNVCAYQFSKKSWIALGAGLDGPITTITPLQLNITANTPETTIAFSGKFTQIRANGKTSSSNAAGLAIWVPSKNDWLQNLNVQKQYLAGSIDATTIVPKGPCLIAGTLSSAGWALSGAVELTSSSGNVGLQQFPVKFQQQSQTSSSSKRADSQQSLSGVIAGAYYNSQGRNVTILGGSFSATATNGSTVQNLLFVTGSNNDAVTGPASGIDASSTFRALSVQGDSLFAGGDVTGEINGNKFKGLVVYDLKAASYRKPQPAALVGKNVAVNAIATKPGSTAVYVAGSFQSTSQGLQCSTVCMYDTSTNQWNPVGNNMQGTVLSLFWTSNTAMMAAGNLVIGANSTSSGTKTSIATYDTNSQSWTAGNSSSIPGDITAFAPATSDGTELWMAGTAKNGSTFLTALNKNDYYPFGGMFGSGTTIRGLQLISLSHGHSTYSYLDGMQSLLVTGALNLKNFGNCAAAIFDGQKVTPFILASTSSGQPGSIAQLFSSKQNTLKSSRKLCLMSQHNYLKLTHALRYIRSLKGHRCARRSLCGIGHFVPHHTTRPHPRTHPAPPIGLQPHPQRHTRVRRQALQHLSRPARAIIRQSGPKGRRCATSVIRHSVAEPFTYRHVLVWVYLL